MLFGLLVFNRNTECVCVCVYRGRHTNMHTHTQQMFFWPFPHQRRYSEVFVLEYCCPQSCRPLPESALPERKRRREKQKKQKRRGKRNRKHDLLTEKIGESGMKEKESGSVLQWKSTALTNNYSSCGTGPL